MGGTGFDIDLFFEPEPLLMNEGLGFDMYGPEHAVALALCVALIWALVRRYVRLPEGTGAGTPRRRQQAAMAVVPVALLASRDVIMVAEGCFSDFYLPLHSCNICEFVTLAYVVWPAAWLGEVICTLGLLGGLAALLMCGWSYCPIWSYVSVGGFVEHSLLVAFALCIVVGRDFVPARSRIWQPVLFTGVMAALAKAFNTAHGTNFCFVSWPIAGTPLEQFCDWLGNPGYLVPYGLGVLLCYVGLYALYGWAAAAGGRPGAACSSDAEPPSISQNA